MMWLVRGRLLAIASVVTCLILLAASALEAGGPAWAPAPTPGAADESSHPAAEEAAKPKALLVRHPSPGPGDPPFALADAEGRVQRLVEPTPGVELDPYVGQIVLVNHDTGPTLLATQLDLPQLFAPPSMVRVATAGAPSGIVQALHQPGETLPPPIVLEEITGEPEGPTIDGLRFPPSMQPAQPTPPPAGAPIAPYIGCAGAVNAYGPPVVYGPGCSPVATRWWRPWTWRVWDGLDFSVDALWLRTHDSAAVNAGDDFDFGSRWEVGYTGTWGRRLALRYFEYDTSLTTGWLSMESLDLEFQRWFPCGCGVAVGVGGGLRWTEYDEVITPAIGVSYDNTIGPVLGLYARAPAFYAVDGILTLRQSYQFGDSNFAGATDRGVFGITELQFGLEHRRCTRFGQTVVRGVFETQYWDDAGPSANGNGGRGLIGLGLGVGLQR